MRNAGPTFIAYQMWDRAGLFLPLLAALPRWLQSFFYVSEHLLFGFLPTHATGEPAEIPKTRLWFVQRTTGWSRSLCGATGT